jgi:hypothetical protein
MKRIKARKTFFLLVLAMSVLVMTGCGGHWTPSKSDNTVPTVPNVTAVIPLDHANGVVLNTRITAAFSEPMDNASITGTTFTVVNTTLGGTPVAGTVAYAAASRTATFTPTDNLASNTLYTARITTGARNPQGIALASNFTWSFTTGLTFDVTRPRVTVTVPDNAATGVPTNANILATFSEAMAPLTIDNTTFRVAGPGAATVAGSVAYAVVGRTATFNPLAALPINTLFTATITTGATDLAGNTLAGNQAPPPATSNYIWTFRTGAVADNTAPTVVLTVPDNAATGVAVDGVINATFSKAMAPLTISTATFTLQASGPPLGGILGGTTTYSVTDNLATFTPTDNLAFDTSYTATVTSGAMDLTGKALVVPAVNGLPKPNPWTFRTASAPLVPLAINLGSASSFGIASRAGLTSTGITVINGDVALHPLAGCTDSTGNSGASQTCLVKTYSSSTGMTVNGSIYWAGDPFDAGATALSVSTALNLAWVEGAAKVPTQPTIAADQLASPTPYVPGVYHNANLTLAAGGVATLDGLGNSNAIFIFQVDSDLVDSGTLLLPSRIVLTRGAQARNVWFVAGRDITIGSGTTWNGNILAGRTATVLDGSTVNGRVLAGAAGAGAVTLTGAASPSVTTISVPQ